MPMTLDKDRLERIRTWAQGYVDARTFAGLSVLILQDGHEVFFDTRGLRDLDTAAPFERGHRRANLFDDQACHVIGADDAGGGGGGCFWMHLCRVTCRNSKICMR